MTFNKCSIDGKMYGYIFDSQNNEIEINDVNLKTFFFIKFLI